MYVNVSLNARLCLSVRVCMGVCVCVYVTVCVCILGMRVHVCVCNSWLVLNHPILNHADP